jgi:glycosyltransferase involved in cell wall biosynthesis
VDTRSSSSIVGHSSHGPVVSILMPFLDAGPFIREAIESVCAQSYQSWELLLIDDGSSDGSASIAQEYASSDPERIRCLRYPVHENRGKSAALNFGLRHARGRYIAMLDADDVWLPEKLQAHVPLLDQHPEAGMLYGNTVFWRSWDRKSDAAADTVPPLGVPVDTVVRPPELLVRCVNGTAVAPCTCSVLMRRDIVEAVGGFEEAFRKVFTDQAFYAKMFLAAPVYVAAGIWEKYRIHDRSAVMTAKRSNTLLAARRAYLEFLADYLRRTKVDRGELWRTVRLQLWLARHPRAASVLVRARARWQVGRVRLSQGLPPAVRQRAIRLVRPRGGVRFGNLRRITPLSRQFGCDRGEAVDREYIEQFLRDHAGDITGRVLEIGDDAYTRRFGGTQVHTADVLDVRAANERATFIDDLTTGEQLPSDTFDCIVLTQTLHLIYDVRAAVATVHRILKPGGVALVTVPGITPIDRGKHTWWWSLTPASARRLFAEHFPESELHVCSFGNVLTATAFLYGIAREELRERELRAQDPQYPVIVALRARKPAEPTAR